VCLCGVCGVCGVWCEVYSVLCLDWEITGGEGKGRDETKSKKCLLSAVQ
jgi:hypothetical protein